MSTLGPIREQERISSLDVLRGLAIFGIFMVNMQVFAMPFGEFFAPSISADTPLRQALSWVFVKAFFEYKYISLFSFLFGAGLIIQMTRAQLRERRFVPMYVRRLGILAAIGLVHGFGLWYGDILFLYACIGAVVLLVRRLSAKVLLIIAGSILGAFVALQVLVAVLIFAWLIWFQPAGEVSSPAQAPPVVEPAATATEELADAAAREEPEEDLWSQRNPELAERIPWLAVMLDANFNMTSEAWRAAETTAYRDGPWSDAMGFRAVSYILAVGLAPMGYGWHVLLMFLTGAALMKLDFFGPSRIRWQRRLGVLGLAIGLPLELANAIFAWVAVVNDRWDLAGLGGVVHEIGSVALCLGLVGSVSVVVAAGRLRRVTAALACVGRLALSNYLLQTVVATFLMYWWGLGWFGDVSRLQQIGLVVAIYLGQVFLSMLWLRFFTIGPLEWLWRTLTYLKAQPLLRRRPVTVA